MTALQRQAWKLTREMAQRSVLQALEELLMADNKLEGLPEGLFQALRNLRTVVLYGNALRGLPAGPFLSSNLKGDPSGPSDPKADSLGMPRSPAHRKYARSSASNPNLIKLCQHLLCC